MRERKKERDRERERERQRERERKQKDPDRKRGGLRVKAGGRAESYKSGWNWLWKWDLPIVSAALMHIKALWSACMCLCVRSGVCAPVHERRGSLWAVIDLTKLQDRFFIATLTFTSHHLFSASRPWQHYPPLYGPRLCMGALSFRTLTQR